MVWKFHPLAAGAQKPVKALPVEVPPAEVSLAKCPSSPAAIAQFETLLKVVNGSKRASPSSRVSQLIATSLIVAVDAITLPLLRMNPPSIVHTDVRVKTLMPSKEHDAKSQSPDVPDTVIIARLSGARMIE
jgi:hypothetical protein